MSKNHQKFVISIKNSSKIIKKWAKNERKLAKNECF